MAFCVFESNSLPSSDPYIYSKRLILSHPSVTHALVLTELAEGYNANWNNFLRSEDRSLTGSLGISGGTRNPAKQVPVTCTVTKQQLNLFEELKRYQDNTLQPITIQDKFETIVYFSGIMDVPNWLSGYPVTNALGQSEGYAAFTVWVDVDENYFTYIGSDWYLLQFQFKSV